MSKQKINLKQWNRSSHFEFFKNFKEPFFGVTVEVDCTTGHKNAKQLNTSFFLYYLYQSLRAVNALEPFKLRIEDGEVVLYDQIHPGPTVGRDNGTFGFCNFEYNEDFEVFAAGATVAMDKVKNENDLKPSPRLDLIYYSTLPWINFTSLTHARDLERNDSVPKISFGKLTDKDGILLMPMSVHVHHALADGLHVGQYIDLFQCYMNEPL